MANVDRDGVFRARPIKSGLRKTTNGAVEWNALFSIEAWWNKDTMEWEQCADDGIEIWGGVTLIKTDGVVNEHGLKTAREALGWNGDFASLDGDLSQKRLNLEVGLEPARVFKGTNYPARYRVNWVNPARDDPRPSVAGGPPVDAKALNARFGSLVRAKLAAMPGVAAQASATQATARPPVQTGADDLTPPASEIPF